LVTGGATGVGERTIHLLAARRGAVVISDIEGEAGDAVAHKVAQAGGHGVFSQPMIEHLYGDARDVRRLVTDCHFLTALFAMAPLARYVTGGAVMRRSHRYLCSLLIHS
jgi:NADPH:quinone reductase-like Zn-dependent oxidoreductase